MSTLHMLALTIRAVLTTTCSGITRYSGLVSDTGKLPETVEAVCIQDLEDDELLANYQQWRQANYVGIHEGGSTDDKLHLRPVGRLVAEYAIFLVLYKRL